ncbi:MAG: hypothetical protein PQJ46_07290 [Spirochaetales bacterium]|nr:hypothetical protein [Spirochaetales bacterium]
MEAGMESHKEIQIKGLNYKSIENLHAVKTIYRGNYGGQGSTYLRLFNYCHKKGYTPKLPIIEHFVKGPGSILISRPENYITECIVLFEK